MIVIIVIAVITIVLTKDKIKNKNKIKINKSFSKSNHISQNFKQKNTQLNKINKINRK